MFTSGPQVQRHTRAESTKHKCLPTSRIVRHIQCCLPNTNESVPPLEPHSCFSCLVFLMLLDVKVSCPVLALQADVLVNQKVAGGRIDGSADGEADDNTCGAPMSLWSWCEQACIVGAAHRGGSAQEGSSSGAADAERQCAL
jgi:hypothetical protein